MTEISNKPLPSPNAVQVLPPTFPNKNIELRVYKSQVNTRRDILKNMRRIEVNQEVKLEPNKSGEALINYGYEYPYIPRIKIDLISPDDEFDLQFLTKEKNKKFCIVKINNSSDQQRTVIVEATIKSRKDQPN